MQKTENIYMQDNNRRMPEITDDSTSSSTRR